MLVKLSYAKGICLHAHFALTALFARGCERTARARAWRLISSFKVVVSENASYARSRNSVTPSCSAQ